MTFRNTYTVAIDEELKALLPGMEAVGLVARDADGVLALTPGGRQMVREAMAKRPSNTPAVLLPTPLC